MKMSVEAQNPQIVDLYPFLRLFYKFVPTQFDSYKRQLQEIADIEMPTFNTFLEMAKANLASGKIFPSMCTVPREELHGENRCA